MHTPNKNDLNILKDLIGAGKLETIIDKVYSFNETAKAFQYYGEGNFKGKIVITMDQNYNTQ